MSCHIDFDVRLVVPDQIGQPVEFHNFEAEEIKFADFEFIEDRAPEKTEGSDMQALREWSLRIIGQSQAWD